MTMLCSVKAGDTNLGESGSVMILRINGDVAAYEIDSLKEKSNERRSRLPKPETMPVVCVRMATVSSPRTKPRLQVRNEDSP